MRKRRIVATAASAASGVMRPSRLTTSPRRSISFSRTSGSNVPSARTSATTRWKEFEPRSTAAMRTSRSVRVTPRRQGAVQNGSTAEIIDTEHVEPVIRAMVGAATGRRRSDRRAARGHRRARPDVLRRRPRSGGRSRRSVPTRWRRRSATRAQRRRVRELLVLVELGRHPHQCGPGRRGSRSTQPRWGRPVPAWSSRRRDLVTGGVATASADYMRSQSPGFVADLTASAPRAPAGRTTVRRPARVSRTCSSA